MNWKISCLFVPLDTQGNNTARGNQSNLYMPLCVELRIRGVGFCHLLTMNVLSKGRRGGKCRHGACCRSWLHSAAVKMGRRVSVRSRWRHHHFSRTNWIGQIMHAVSMARRRRRKSMRLSLSVYSSHIVHWIRGVLLHLVVLMWIHGLGCHCRWICR